MSKLAKVIPDLMIAGRWLQRYTVGEKYTWTVSGAKWNNIKGRCDPNGILQIREPTYIGSVNKFDNWESFVQWHRYQIGYGNLDYQLDSDILMQDGKKVYSENTCLLIPSRLNKFLQSPATERNDKTLPVGLYATTAKPDVVICSISSWMSGRKIILGNFRHEDIDIAQELYLREKNRHRLLWVEHLKTLTDIDPRVFDYMERLRFTKNGKELL